MWSVPTIDYALPDQQLSAQWKDAFSTVGFARIVNHPLSCAGSKLAALSRAFFSQPQDVKLRSSLSDRYGFGGYTPQGRENVGKTLESARAATRKADPVESLVFCGPVVPGLDPELRDASAEYYRTASAIILRLMKLTALALGLSPDFFDESYQSPSHSLRLAKYGRIEASDDDDDNDDALLYGAHCDYTGYTLLLASPLLGLEVHLPGAEPGQWTPVPSSAADDGAILVNSGDLIKRWTGDAFHSTLHRVRKVANNDADRLSIVFFSGPNDDTLVTAINGKYPPIKAGEHLREKLEKSNV
jgi:isopenicillin N synthase-like dioxygenase